MIVEQRNAELGLHLAAHLRVESPGGDLEIKLGNPVAIQGADDCVGFRSGR